MFNKKRGSGELHVPVFFVAMVRLKSDKML
jgi:hypothetical protein